MPHIDPLADRQARYERIKAMADDGKTLDDIGTVFGISRERVRQVLAKPPRKPGPPFNPRKVEQLRARLTYWETVRTSRLADGKSTTVSDARIAALTAKINKVRSFELP